MTVAESKKGFIYEQNVARYLANKGLARRGNAGSKSDRPDIILKQRGLTAGCELKIHGKSAGSLRLHYDNKVWHFAEDPEHALEKEVLRNLSSKYGILDIINRRWKAPAKWDTSRKMTSYERMEIDKGQFPEINVPVGAWELGHYYNAKDTWYLNIGSAGFYLLSKRDPLYINKKLKTRKDELVPLFADNGSATCNCRLQIKDTSRGNYGFILALRVRVPVLGRSPYNIGALLGDGPDLDYMRTNIKCLL